MKITFEELVQFMSDNSDIVFINAFRESVRRNPNIPEGIRGLLCGSNEGNSGYIASQFQIIRQMIGTMELAYRRGMQEGEESK